MINRFTDHAANERTFLAWVRTAIAIMAFGFIIEKFDLFVVYTSKLAGSSSILHASPWVELVGLGLLIVGTLLVIGSTIRF